MGFNQKDTSPLTHPLLNFTRDAIWLANTISLYVMGGMSRWVKTMKRHLLVVDFSHIIMKYSDVLLTTSIQLYN